MTKNYLFIRIKYSFYRIKEEGFLWFIHKIFNLSINYIMYILLIPLNIFLYLLNYRLVPILVDRIGHLAGESDCFIKLKLMGIINSDSKYLLLKDKNKICNEFFFDLLSKYFIVIDNKYLIFVLNFLSLGPGIKFNINKFILAIETSCDYYYVNSIYTDRMPLFKFPNDKVESCISDLSKIGMSSKKKFVCLHVRSEGYSIEDDRVHSHRNFPKESMYESILQIIKNGDNCVLMGDTNAPVFPKISGLIDYAHSEIRSDILDVYLCSHAKFFLGNSSGLFILSSVFNVPCALTNIMPFACTGFKSTDISIPKLIFNSSNGQFLNIQEIMHSKICNYRNAIQFRDHNLELVSNDSSDILSLTMEMYNLIENKLPQDYFLQSNKIFTKYLNVNNYCFMTQSNISNHFILKHNSIFF